MSLNEIGTKLKELRIKNNITQDELASNLYLSRQAVSRWETGKSIPDYQTLILICKFYNVNMDYFFDNNNVKDKKYYFNLVFENFNKQKIINKFKIIIIILIVFVIIIFSLFYTLYTFNKNNIYELKYRSNELVCNSGLIITSPKKIIFKPCVLSFSDGAEINNIEIYYYEQNDKRIILSGGPNILNFTWKDKRNVSELFNYGKINIDNNLPNIYLKITTEDNVEKTIILDSRKI